MFEWDDLSAAVEAARETFTIVELGAGYGRWSVASVVMAQARGLRAKAIAVEAEPDHFKMMLQHFIDNGLNPTDHRLIEAAATSSDRPVYFVIGHARDWYGQAILPVPDYGYGNWPQASVATIQGLSLATIIGDVPVIDLLDMDVQGEEGAILRANGPLLNKRVKRALIATHNREVEAELRKFFRGLGWKCRCDFGCRTEAETEHGRMKFEDGVQSWINPGYLRRRLQC